MTQETQDLLDELATPTHHAGPALNTWVKATATIVRLRGQQIALLRGMIQEAEGTELDVPLLGKLETLVQVPDAQARILNNIAKELRSFQGTRRQMQELVAELNVLAVAAGYTI